jgi:hypothetical protein
MPTMGIVNVRFIATPAITDNTCNMVHGDGHAALVT